MPMILRRTFGALFFVCALYAGLSPVTPAFAAIEDKDLASALRAGGFVIVLRHGSTFSDQADTDPFHLDNIGAQRNLDDKGKALATNFGDALRKVGVPIGEVYTSYFDRAYQTGVLAGFKDVKKTLDVTEGGLVVSPKENSRRSAALRQMASTAPKPGMNTIIISHKPNIVDAFGKDWFDIKEGEASIFKPENGKYVLVAKVQMDEWPRIAAAK